MAPRPSIARRLAAAAFLPVGVGLTSWTYMWRTTPMHRGEREGNLAEDGPPPLPGGIELEEVQRVEDGFGPLFHRRFRVRITEPEIRSEEVMTRIKADPNRVAPREFANFRKASGPAGRMAVGDEYLVRMPGPWDGPVRVIDESPTSFRLMTLDGHLEAGQIEFRCSPADEGALLFEIEAWAKSGDRFSRILFQHLRMAKEIQLHMWTSVLEHVVELARGRMPDGVEIDTRRVTESGRAG